MNKCNTCGTASLEPYQNTCFNCAMDAAMDTYDDRDFDGPEV